jgi:hypothetical protein
VLLVPVGNLIMEASETCSTVLCAVAARTVTTIRCALLIPKLMPMNHRQASSRASPRLDG